MYASTKERATLQDNNRHLAQLPFLLDKLKGSLKTTAILFFNYLNYEKISKKNSGACVN